MRFERDWKWGLRLGLSFATLYSVFVVGLFVVQGDQPFLSKGISLSSVVVAYYAGGALAGVIVGLLRPLAGTRIGAIVVGVISFFVISAGIGVVLFGWMFRWGSDEWLTVLTMALIFGSFFGNFVWDRYLRPQ
jgi:hypothetical protein